MVYFIVCAHWHSYARIGTASACARASDVGLPARHRAWLFVRTERGSPTNPEFTRSLILGPRSLSDPVREDDRCPRLSESRHRRLTPRGRSPCPPTVLVKRKSEETARMHLTSTPPSPQNSHVLPMRPSTACKSCRERRRACVGMEAGAPRFPCRRCTKMKMVYVA